MCCVSVPEAHLLKEAIPNSSFPADHLDRVFHFYKFGVSVMRCVVWAWSAILEPSSGLDKCVDKLLC